MEYTYVYSLTYRKIEEETTVFDKTLYIYSAYTLYTYIVHTYVHILCVCEIEMNFSFGYYGNCHPTHLFYETFETLRLLDKMSTQSVSTQT